MPPRGTTRAGRRPATYPEHVARERTRREQARYREQARAQVGTELGDPREPGLARRTAGRAGSAAYRASVRGEGLPGPTYHRVILAEFLLCVVVITASPFLDQGKGSSSPVSLARPLVRLSAVAVVFFVLALMASSARAGKAAAAFGGLVTLGTLLNATGTVAGLSAALGPVHAAAAHPDGGSRPSSDSASIAEPAPPGDTASIREP